MRPRSSAIPLLGLLACVPPDARPGDGSEPPSSASGVVPGDPAPSDDWTPREPPNLLLVLLDDVGAEMIGAYGVDGHHAPPTPHLDALAAEGVLFTHAWAHPWCSPTRAALFTGRSARHLGIGRAIEPFQEYTTLAEAETTWMEALADASPWPYRRAFFGKWHLSSAAQGPDAPRDHGIEHFSGTLGNLDSRHAFDGRPQSYRRWEHIVDGRVERVEGYATTRTVDDALAWIGEQDGPWAAWVSLHAAHSPRHVPPLELHGYGNLVDEVGAWRTRAMIEAADHEIGRLIRGLGTDVRARTMIVVAGDNGSPPVAGLGPFEGRRGKSFVDEHGVRVPLVVAGPAVTRPAVVRAIVQLTDLYDTFVELGGVELSPTDTPDSVSLVPYLRDPDHPPLRSWIHTEAFAPNVGDRIREPSDQRAAADGTWKLIVRDGRPELHRIGADLLEGAPLPEEDWDEAAHEAHDRLAVVLDADGE